MAGFRKGLKGFFKSSKQQTGSEKDTTAAKTTITSRNSKVTELESSNFLVAAQDFDSTQRRSTPGNTAITSGPLKPAAEHLEETVTSTEPGTLIQPPTVRTPTGTSRTTVVQFPSSNVTGISNRTADGNQNGSASNPTSQQPTLTLDLQTFEAHQSAATGISKASVTARVPEPVTTGSTVEDEKTALRKK